jgi:glycosyltransferase involved in cell wall biosynthesis
MSYLSLIIPAYNEEKRIGRTLQAVSAHLTKQPYDYEILVVNDGSRDGTASLVRNLAKSIPRLGLIDNKENRGKGFAVRQAMLKATGAVRLFMDSDNSTDIKYFDAMRPLFTAGAHIVIATRDRRDDPDATQAVPQSFIKRLAGDLGNLVIQVLVLPGIWDTQCGFKAFTAEAAHKIFSQAKVDRWAFDVEALGLAKKLGYRIAVVPVHWINDADSRVKPLAYAQFFFEVIKIWRRLRRMELGIRN